MLDEISGASPVRGVVGLLAKVAIERNAEIRERMAKPAENEANAKDAENVKSATNEVNAGSEAASAGSDSGHVVDVVV